LPRGRCAKGCQALSFAALAAFGLVLELFVVKKQLLACGKYKIPAAVDALQHPVSEFHPELLWPKQWERNHREMIAAIAEIVAVL